MSADDIISFAIPAAVVAAFAFFGYTAWKTARSAREAIAGAAKRNEALFQSLFPDLQPHFHPERLHQFVKAWRARTPATGAFTWNNPPGFPDGTAAAFEPGPKGQQVRVQDAAGVILAQFLLEPHTEGGAVRMGPGKFTVNIQDAQDERVRYWHPKREFKWSRRKGWKFVTPIADESIDSDDRGSSYSRDSSSSSSSTSRTAAAAAGVAGLGGTFDGGGASGGWDDSGGGTKGSDGPSY